MKLSHRSAGLAALALTVSLGLSACSDDDTSGNDTAETPAATSEAPMDEESTAPAADEAFGPACDQLPESGDGSLEVMADQPVATAASGNPLLSTLVTALQEADLVDTLNDAEALTVFAPTNDAFDALPEDELDALLADKEALTEVLTHHVVGAEAGPDAIAGDHETLNGTTVTVEGSGEDWTVDEAAIICANVDTANAKVYVVDTVLMP